MSAPDYQPQHEIDFAEWDLAHFRRAGELLTQIAQRRDGVQNMRRAILALYFKDVGAVEGETGAAA